MQRADEAKTAKPPFAQSRIRMCADIVEGMPTLPGTAYDDLAPVDHDRAGLPNRKIGRIEHPPKFMFAHTAPEVTRFDSDKFPRWTATDQCLSCPATPLMSIYEALRPDFAGAPVRSWQSSVFITRLSPRPTLNGWWHSIAIALDSSRSRHARYVRTRTPAGSASMICGRR